MQPRKVIIRRTNVFNGTGNLETSSRIARVDDLDILHLSPHETPCIVVNKKSGLQNMPPMKITVSSPSSDRFQDSSPTVISRKANGGLCGVQHKVKPVSRWLGVNSGVLAQEPNLYVKRPSRLLPNHLSSSFCFASYRRFSSLTRGLGFVSGQTSIRGSPALWPLRPLSGILPQSP